jgi:signal transduction histidine kinase
MKLEAGGEPDMAEVNGVTRLLPLDRELRERLDWFIRLRWLAAAGILAGCGLGPQFLSISLPILPLVLVALAVLLYNLAFHLSRSRIASNEGSLRGAIHLQIGLDWAALACTVYLTGGIGSPVSLSFVFHLIIGAILLTRRACYLLAASASLLLGSLALLTVFHPLPIQGGFSAGAAENPAHALQIWAGLTVFFVVTTYLATSITARLREKEVALFQSERALDLACREMESLYEVGQLVNSTLDVNEVLTLIAENTTRLLNGKACFIRLLDKSGKKLFIGGWHGLSRAYLNKGPVEVEKSLVDAEALAGATIQVLEVGDDKRFQYREEARREGLRSLLSCPMRAKNRTLGVIRVYTGELHVFSEQEQKLLMNVANLGAIAILNARSYGELLALDQERVWFARTTHHELRAPLAAAQGAMEALSFAGPLTKMQQDLVARAQRRIEESFNMIRDLLDLAAAQRLEDQAALPLLSLAETLKPVLEAAREQALAKGLTFEEKFDLQGCLLRAGAADIARIFANLLNNAVKYTRSGAVIFGARAADGWVEAWVQDTGMGIDEQDLGRIFKAFYRTSAAKTAGITGTGLGLSIVRQVVERLGGTVSVASEPGRGTRFDVRLPLARA